MPELLCRADGKAHYMGKDMNKNIAIGPESPLRVNVENGELVIRVGINLLDGNDYHNRIPSLKIDNREEWANDVISEIQREEEDGESPLTKMIDDAIIMAIENGSTGLSEDSFTHIGECPICETDQVPLRHTKNGTICGDCVDKKIWWKSKHGNEWFLK